jgi:diaminohydroxyphosphoribosylaminopyrimidine deaminase/5-amino-6-(5-phosphoribosylamino)uracil reductase
MTDANDKAHMQAALALARRGLGNTWPNPAVGCVILGADGQVVGRGWTQPGGRPHAEAVALERAGAAARGGTAYVTLEPCSHWGRTPPCCDALIRAGVRRVVVASGDPDPRVDGRGLARLREAGVIVELGLGREEADRINAGFARRITRGLPLVTLKLATTLDGRIATAQGESKWITGAAARREAHALRARHDAILVGSGTVLADDPELTVRDEPAGKVRPPVRVVLDSGLRLPPGARLLATPGPVVVLAARDDAGRRAALVAAGADVRIVAREGSRVAPAAFVEALLQLECNEVLVEAGPAVNGALLAAGLVDELVVYQAAHVLGDTARAMFALPPLASMDDRPAFRLADVRRVGDDLRLTYLK